MIKTESAIYSLAYGVRRSIWWGWNKIRPI